ncbi:MAG TPA: tetratricopeptide repeat protein [Longimicrobium sp.]|jgi:tetratricopeptide (TPR) repeat protein|uniref:tetratricopeptide repeat protein n=1 Tax=Longimicrobium sp. TaxID=2029185 RepID=UPI002EDA7847
MRMIIIALAAGLMGGGVLAEAERAYGRGDYAAAVAAYRRALQAGDSSAVVRYNLGTSLLRMGRYDDARPHLEAAARARRIAGRAAYNAGNADLVPAAAGKTPPDAREPALRRAVTRYRQALLHDPADADARWNLELAQRLLDEEQKKGGGGGGGPQPDPAPNAGGGNAPNPATPPPAPAGQGGAGGMTPQQAERVLDGAERREQQVQRRELKRDQAESAGVRDW